MRRAGRIALALGAGALALAEASVLLLGRGLIDSATPALVALAWAAELVVHFQVLHGLAALGLLAASLWLRAWVPGALALACLPAPLLALAPYLPAGAPAATVPATFTVAAFNVWHDRADAPATAAWLAAARVDVVVLAEATDRWDEVLAARLPHRLARFGRRGEGLAIHSRWPIEPVPALDALLPWSVIGGRVCPAPERCAIVLGTHTTSPITPARVRARDAVLARLAAALEVVRAGPVVVAGDLNTTPWSPAFGALLARGGLADSAVGRGLFASWNRRFLVPLVPIDHLLHSPALSVVSRGLGPHLGSDHLPVIARFGL